MGKRHMHHHDADEDFVVSGGSDDVDYEALLVAMDKRNARQKRRYGKSARNRFDDYEQDKWLQRQVDDWDDDLDFDDDLSFDDDD